MIKLFRVPVRLHPLFVLIMFTAIFTGHFIELMTLFAIVIIHELGHVWAAKEVGWTIREIKLLPFGGVAEVEQQGNSTPGEEIFVALAGPVQHVWMILLAFSLEAAGLWSGEWTGYFIEANVMVGLFNLIPVLPLDGGKVLQALLSLRLPFYRVLFVCNVASLLFSSFITLYALASISNGLHLNLLAIGLFLFFSNWVEYRLLAYRYMRFLTNRVHVLEQRAERVLRLPEPIFVEEHQRLHEIVRMLRKGKVHRIFIVDHRDQVKATLSEQELLQLYFQSSA